MKKLLVVFAVIGLTTCTTNNFTANVTGISDYSIVAIKDFVTLGIITVRAEEVHYSSPLGFVRSVQGSKITYTDLMQEAAKLEADDIINVRIDMNANYTKGIFDWITGWTRTFTYTATALAIKYTDKVDAARDDPQLHGLPSVPEQTPAVRTTKSGEVELR